jgi:hypothetical protein
MQPISIAVSICREGINPIKGLNLPLRDDEEHEQSKAFSLGLSHCPDNRRLKNISESEVPQV